MVRKCEKNIERQNDLRERETLTNKSASRISVDQKGRQPTSWTYNEIKDEMSSKVHILATNKSVNTVNFAFPYQGVQRGYFIVSGDTVLFRLDKGQIICQGESNYGTCLVRIKFDDDKDRFVKAAASGDDSTTIRITEPSFLENLMKSKKLKIQLKVFQEGVPVFTFNVGGLLRR